MAFQRQVIFWLGALVVFVLALWLLSEILLPFVAGLAIAYLLTPLTDRLERLGVNRLVGGAAHHNIGRAGAGLSHLACCADPRRAMSSFIESVPGNVDQIAGAAQRSEPPLDPETIGRRLSAQTNQLAIW